MAFETMFSVNPRPSSKISTSEFRSSETGRTVPPHPILPCLVSKFGCLKDEFRDLNLLDLPAEILLLIIDYLIINPGNRSWIASGFHRDCGIPTAEPRFCEARSSPDSTKYSLPQHNCLAIHCEPTSLTTRSLLLTNRQIRALTWRVLITCFSGILRLTSINEASQSQGSWCNLTLLSPFVIRNNFLLTQVQQLEIHHCHEAWPDLSNIMPSLKRIKQLSSQALWCRISIVTNSAGEAVGEDDGSEFNTMDDFYHGIHDEKIIATGVLGAARWIEWCELENEKRLQTSRSLEMAVLVRVGEAWDHPWVEWVSQHDLSTSFGG